MYVAKYTRKSAHIYGLLLAFGLGFGIGAFRGDPGSGFILLKLALECRANAGRLLLDLSHCKWFTVVAIYRDPFETPVNSRYKCQ